MLLRVMYMDRCVWYSCLGKMILWCWDRVYVLGYDTKVGWCFDTRIECIYLVGMILYWDDTLICLYRGCRRYWDRVYDTLGLMLEYQGWCVWVCYTWYSWYSSAMYGCTCLGIYSRDDMMILWYVTWMVIDSCLDSVMVLMDDAWVDMILGYLDVLSLGV